MVAGEEDVRQVDIKDSTGLPGTGQPWSPTERCPGLVYKIQCAESEKTWG